MGGPDVREDGSKRCKCCGQYFHGNDDVCGAESCRKSGFSKFGATATCSIPVGQRFHSIIYGNRVYTPQEFANEFNCEVKIGINVFYPKHFYSDRGRV